MIYGRYSSIIDYKIKNYLTQLNNNFMNKCRNRLPYKMDNLQNLNTAISKPLDIIPPYIYILGMAFSFLSGYHFRSLVEYRKYF